MLHHRDNIANKMMDNDLGFPLRESNAHILCSCNTCLLSSLWQCGRRRTHSELSSLCRSIASRNKRSWQFRAALQTIASHAPNSDGETTDSAFTRAPPTHPTEEPRQQESSPDHHAFAYIYQSRKRTVRNNKNIDFRTELPAARKYETSAGEWASMPHTTTKAPTTTQLRGTSLNP